MSVNYQQIGRHFDGQRRGLTSIQVYFIVFQVGAMANNGKGCDCHEEIHEKQKSMSKKQRLQLFKALNVDVLSLPFKNLMYLRQLFLHLPSRTRKQPERMLYKCFTASENGTIKCHSIISFLKCVLHLQQSDRVRSFHSQFVPPLPRRTPTATSTTTHPLRTAQAPWWWSGILPAAAAVSEMLWSSKTARWRQFRQHGRTASSAKCACVVR